MAVKPQIRKLNATNDQIINAVMNEIDPEGKYPRASASYNDDGSLAATADQNRSVLGKIMEGNNELANSYFRTLLNRIIMVVYTNNSYSNPLKRLKGGFLEAGDIVEEIAYDLADPHQYDSTTDIEFPKQEKARVLAAIHRVNFEKYYKRTAPKMKLIKAFQTRGGMDEFVQNVCINALYNSAEVDEFIMFKYVLGRTILNGDMVTKTIKFNENASNEEKKRSLSTVKAIINDMNFMDDQFNTLNMPQRTEKSQILVFTDTNFDAALSVELYAYMFNLPQAEIEESKILLNKWTKFDNERLRKLFTNPDTGEVILDEFTPFTDEELEKLNSVFMYVVDERFFKIWDYLLEFTEFFNPEKLYWNYWLHTWKIISASPFANAVGFSSLENTVTSLSVSPTAITVNAGANVTLSVTVKTSGIGAIPYTITTDNENATVIGNTITVPADASDGDTITATVTCGDKTATSIITVG